MAAKKDDFSVKRIFPKLGGERGTRNSNGLTSSHDLVEQMEFLYVEVVEANDYSATSPVGFPIVEITLGNHKSSTETLAIKPNCKWEQVFAFDRSKGDVLSVAIKDGQTNPKTLIGKRNFKVSADIPSRVPPDARLAPSWYSIRNAETGHHMDLLMSVWFGTQADEVYSRAWFADSCDVSASCVNNTRPELYLAPRLCYVRITIVSGHDLISNDGKRAPSVYVTATLGKHAVKTEIASGSNPTWNRDLILVASEPLDDTVYFKLIDRLDGEHEQCIGVLKKKLSEMTALKTPGPPASAVFYDIEPAVKVSPAGDTRRFASRIKMRLSTDQSYHVIDECSKYASDYRAFAKGLWPGLLGKLEIGILSATDLPLIKTWLDGRNSTDAYVVAKYGNKWAKTRTVINNVSPKWNEQYSWDVYERCTVITLGIYDNGHIVRPRPGDNQTKDAPIGKVRIPLTSLEWNRVYTDAYPVAVLGKQGLKKKGTLNLAVRLVCVADNNTWFTAPLYWMLPKSHYKSPLSLLQIEDLRSKAVEVNCMNLAKTEPPLRNEVVTDMLKPESKNFSMRKMKADWERICSAGTDCAILQWMYIVFAWIQANIITTDDPIPKWAAIIVIELLICAITITNGTAKDILLWCASWWVISCYAAYAIYCFWELYKYLKRQGSVFLNRNKYPPPPLILIDLKLSKLESPNLDELAEEFDTFPSSEADVNVLRMRYDRVRKMLEKQTLLLGDIAAQVERAAYLLSYLNNPFVFVSLLLAVVNIWVYVLPQVWILPFLFMWVNFKLGRSDLPLGRTSFFRRLPSKAHLRF